jgi:hypothetical protein
MKKRLIAIAIAVGCMFGVQQAASAKTHKKSTASAKKHHKKHSAKKAATLTTLRAA